MVRPDSPAKLGAARSALLVLALGLASLGLAAGCRTPRARKGPAYALEIEERNRHIAEQFRAGNLLGIADLYADDAVLIDTRGERLTGRQEIDEFWSAIEAPVDWRLEIRRVFGSDALAYELVRARMTTGSPGEELVALAEHLLLWRRDGAGQWKIALDVSWALPER